MWVIFDAIGQCTRCGQFGRDSDQMVPVTNLGELCSYSGCFYEGDLSLILYCPQNTNKVSTTKTLESRLPPSFLPKTFCVSALVPNVFIEPNFG